MARILLLLLLGSTLSIAAYAQQPAGNITVRGTGLGGVQFEQYGQPISPAEAQRMMMSVPAAFEELKAAKANNVAALIFGGVGGFLVGWPLGAALAGGDPNWTMAGIGAGLVAVSIPFSIKFKQRSIKAVELYNNGGVLEPGIGSLQMRLGITPSGVGLQLRL